MPIFCIARAEKSRILREEYVPKSVSKDSMQNMWISVVLIVLVIVVGLIAGTRLSTPGPQRRAVFSAFGALTVLAIWFFVFIAFFPADWIVPFFTVACIVIPICIYVGVSRGARDKSVKIPKAKSVDTIKAEAPLGPKPPTPEQATAKQSKPSMASSTTAGSTKAPNTSSSQLAQPARTTTSTTSQTSTVVSKPTQAPAATPKKTAETPTAKPEPKPAEQPRTASKPQAPTPETKAAAPRQQKAATTKQLVAKDIYEAPSIAEGTKRPAPTSIPAPQPSTEKRSAKELEKDLVSGTKSTAPEAIDPKIAAAADMDILTNKAIAEEIDDLEDLVKPFENAPQPTTSSDGPDLNIGLPQDRSEAAPQDVESSPTTETTPVSQQAPAPKKPAKPKSAAEAHAEFSARAAALRDQGAYAIAAMLYEEAAAIAPNANASREAQFDGLSCYVKAGDVKKAKEIAAKLRQSSVLTRFERIKLDAVERMG